ncbi:MAG: hypothetical protein ABJC13_06395 [Acidobacteriota bacterium]
MNQTQFQDDCRGRVDEWAARLGLSLSFELVSGRSERYLKGDLRLPQGDEVQIYIYEDEAGFFHREAWHALESQDFDTPDELVKHLLMELLEVLKRP